MFGRDLFIRACNDFTREWYEENGMPQPPSAYRPAEPDEPVKIQIPPHTVSTYVLIANRCYFYYYFNFILITLLLRRAGLRNGGRLSTKLLYCPAETTQEGFQQVDQT